MLRPHHRNMEPDQTFLPPSFIALHIPPGRSKPTATRADMATRYELCEDLAQMLTDNAQTRLFDLGVLEEQVLQRMHQGLLGDPAVVSPDEATWVIRRLAELLNWPLPEDLRLPAAFAAPVKPSR
jgi:Fe2+ transport system protein FeoA